MPMKTIRDGRQRLAIILAALGIVLGLAETTAAMDFRIRPLADRDSHRTRVLTLSHNTAVRQ